MESRSMLPFASAPLAQQNVVEACSCSPVHQEPVPISVPQGAYTHLSVVFGSFLLWDF